MLFPALTTPYAGTESHGLLVFYLRFIDEFFKINQVFFENEMILNMGQLLSIPFVLLGIALLIWAKNKPDPKTAKESQEIGST